MACSDPEGVMEQELGYLTALQSASAYEISADILRLTGADGASIASFARDMRSEIVDVQWKWTALIETEPPAQSVVPDSEEYTLVLHPDGTYEVKADCNLSSGGYVLGGSKLTLQPGPTTLAECEPESLYDEYLALLGNVEGYSVEEGQLTLYLRADAGRMILESAGPAAQP
jgi:heat shock protein HslJ